MLEPLRDVLHKYVPTTFHDPLGLVWRIVRSGDSAALFALNTAALGLISSPLDLLLQPFERRLYGKAHAPELPLIFVCGAPRTGTTLVSQTLIRHLPVTYLNNLTSIFPRSPIIANQLMGRFLNSNSRINFQSYYGKTDGFAGPNDALYIWDRWFGTDRTVVPTEISEETAKKMHQFFGAYQAAWGEPIVNKNNSLNTFAHLIAEVFDNAYFVCMTRDPLYHAQALYRARYDIHGDPTMAYGIHSSSEKQIQASGDPIADVCNQVLFHANIIQEQLERVGPERFLILPYEEFCQDPTRLITKIASDVLNVPLDLEHLRTQLEPFDTTNRVRIDPAIFEQMRGYLSKPVLQEFHSVSSISVAADKMIEKEIVVN